MKAAVQSTPDIQEEVRQTTRVQVQQWFDACDRVLDLHRSSFVYREPASAQLAEHKMGLKLALRTCRSIHAAIADPDFNEPELVSRLQVRIQQLQDAYDTFHDPSVSEAKADAVLREVFPE